MLCLTTAREMFPLEKVSLLLLVTVVTDLLAAAWLDALVCSEQYD